MASLVLYTIYEHPKDYQKEFVVRKWLIGPGTVTADENIFLRKKTLNEARDNLTRLGLRCIGREPDDDPFIVETWI